MLRHLLQTATALLISAFASAAAADTLTVAVASNFRPTLETLSEPFTRQSGHRLNLRSASTGLLYQQIRQGAPFDVFLAADVGRPEKLVEAGLANGLFIYVRGRLALAGNGTLSLPGADQPLDSLFDDPRLTVLAIANPRTAPYGRAAMAWLQANGWPQDHTTVANGSNVAQTLLLLTRKHAQLALLPVALMREHPGLAYREIPPADYPTIEQAAVRLRDAPNPAAADAFMAYLRSTAVQQQLREHGYHTEISP